ncbi:hypothetical protein [Deinococcus sp.]|uniref:hypothetical protein n=1 Tax=Deinococcus sp. TaxID=47478 RepID=UPI003CC580C5
MRPLLALLPLLALPIAAAQSDENPEQPLMQCGGSASLGLPAGMKPGLYRGTLGAKNVTLQLLAGRKTQDYGDPADRYVYDHYGIDIVLNRGRSSGGALLLAEFARSYPKLSARGCFELKAAGQGLSGRWRTPDGQKTLAVKLSRVEVAALPLNLPATPGLLALRAKDPFTFLKLNRPWKATGATLTEPLSGVKYPRIAGRPALNAALQDRHLSLAADALDCTAGAFASFGDADTQYNVTVGTAKLQNARLLSVREHADYDCGGAHPDSFTEGLTYDLKTGRRVLLTGKPGAIWPGLDDQKLQALYVANYPTTGNQSCDGYFDGKEPSSSDDALFQVFLTPRGLTIWPGFVPHVAAVCAEEVTLPYAALRRYADPAGVYFKDLYPR